jgi:hypothetical protein
MTSIVAARTDEDIQREVQLEVKRDARVNPNEVGVAFKNGVLFRALSALLGLRPTAVATVGCVLAHAAQRSRCSRRANRCHSPG